jgi:hypothetical protein
MWPHETTSGRGRDVGALRVTACACLRTLRADFTYFTFRGEIHCEMKCEMDQSFHCEITFPDRGPHVGRVSPHGQQDVFIMDGKHFINGMFGRLDHKVR